MTEEMAKQERKFKEKNTRKYEGLLTSLDVSSKLVNRRMKQGFRNLSPVV